MNGSQQMRYVRSRQRGYHYQMRHRLDLELEIATDLSPVELASKVAPLVREALAGMRQSLGLNWSLIFSSCWMGARFGL